MSEDILTFLKNIDNDFPIPLSDKVDLEEYVDKILKYAHYEYEYLDDKIVGMVIGYIENCDDSLSYISVVGVLKEYRGNHIAKKLVNKFISVCKDYKIRKIHLYTHFSNEKAITMYKEIGFYEKKVNNEERKTDMHLFYDVL